MNAPERIPLPDLQSSPDRRNLAIDAVGVAGVRLPLTIRSGRRHVATVANWSMTVALPPETRGAHMSRFIELLERRSKPIDTVAFRALAFEMLQRLGAQSGTIEARFPYFVRKTAPVSGIASQLDYDVRWRAEAALDGECGFTIEVRVPATSLCPCSREISDYGAHNQRSHIAIRAVLAGEMSVEELIAVAERSASCEVYGLLKRVDEKHVTERAYDNPRFAEDLVREVAAALDDERRIAAFTVEAENFESIHNHSAIARIVRPQAANRRASAATSEAPR